MEAAAKPHISAWLELVTTPYGSPLDSTKMFWPTALPRKSHFKAAAKMRAANLENISGRNVGLDHANLSTNSQERNGDISSNPVKIIVGADSEKSVTHTRVVTASALGILASKLHDGSSEYLIDPLRKDLTSHSGVQRQVGLCVVRFHKIHSILLTFLDKLLIYIFIRWRPWFLFLGSKR